MFTDEYFPTMGEDEFHLAKNLFLEINRKARYISFPTVHKGYEKTYTRKVSMK